MSAPAQTIERAQPRGLPTPLVLVCGALVVVGVLAFLAGIFSEHPETAWRAFHVNFLYFGGIAQGGLLLAAIFVIVGAKWPGPVRRIAEGLAAWVPVTFLLAIVGIAGGKYLFPWMTEPIAIKAAWLNPTRFYVTQLGILGVLAALTMVFLRTSVRPTLHGVADQARQARGMFESWSANWQGDEAEQAAAQKKLKRLAPVICLLFAFGYSLVGFDQVMSIEPMWFSNMFGGYFAWGCFLSAVAATALASLLQRNAPGFEGQIDKARMHDLGKMIFAFSIFWMYLFWSQYLVIWYGNLPEEVMFFEERLGTQFVQDKGMYGTRWLLEGFDFSMERISAAPWAKLTLIVWLCNWIIPFWVLLGQRPKKTPAILGGVAAIVLLGFWLERNVLVWPSLVPDDGGAWFGAIQLAIAGGFLGAFVLVYLTYTRIFPSLAVPKQG